MIAQEQSTTPEVLVSESPASWNTRYLSPEGFTCQLTLRADKGSDLLAKATAAMHHLLATGCTPIPKYPPHPSVEKADSKSNGHAHWCHIHQTEMRAWQKNGRAWYSHKVDGEWCKGK